MSYKELTEEDINAIARGANEYDLTELLEAVTFYNDPGYLRSCLMECYFYIASRELSEDKNRRDDMRGTLGVLQDFIHVLDNTFEESEPRIRMFSATEAANLAALRPKLEESERKRELDFLNLMHYKAHFEAWQDIYNDLESLVGAHLTPEERKAHTSLKETLLWRASVNYTQPATPAEGEALAALRSALEKRHDQANDQPSE